MKELLLDQIKESNKIRVFISSKCGEPKYDSVRKKLKNLIENTGLAQVYVFENEGASTLSAGSHYREELEDSDVCIFLIDNKDKIPDGVKEEHDIVKKYNKKALYYFCYESSSKATKLEKSLMGASYAKSQHIYSFKDFRTVPFVDLLNDIFRNYRRYCNHRLIEIDNDENDSSKKIDIQDLEKHHEITIPKVILKKIDRSIEYLLNTVADCHYYNPTEENTQTSDLDDWGVEFLGVLLEGKDIKNFNTSLFLNKLREKQTPDFHKIVSQRWQAIESYFNGNIQECINKLKEALKLSDKNNQSSWIKNDILIDLRNQQWELELTLLNNTNFDFEAQNALDNSKEVLYYPVLDRINELLQKKYIQGLYEKKIALSYTTNKIFGSGNLNQLGELLTSTYVIALYNGSLTHILLFYDKIKDFLFYLSNKYSDYQFKRNLLKYVISNGNAKEVQGIINAYPEILNRLSADEAHSIMMFSSKYPIKYKRQIRMLIAFGKIGYYLDDTSFKEYEKEIIKVIEDWINDDNPTVSFGQNVFNSLSEVSDRMSQDALSKICCLFIDKHFLRWYSDMFNFISKRIDLNKMSDENAKKLIAHIISIIENENEIEQIKNNNSFLSSLRKQNIILTDGLDKQISKYLPEFYEFEYKLETTEPNIHDNSIFLEKLIMRVHQSNIKQGKNGSYSFPKVRYILRIISIFQESNFNYSVDLMDTIISTVIETLIESKESVLIKLDAILLLCHIKIKYPKDCSRNHELFQRVINCENKIYDVPILISNISSLALKIGLKMLFLLFDKDIYADMIELLPLITNDTATAIKVTEFIAEYLEINESLIIKESVEKILFYNTFEWLKNDSTAVRYNATRIMMTLSRNKENVDIINRKILSLIESDNMSIKTLILTKLNENHFVSDEIKKRVIDICKNDNNYVTRMVCKELKYESN